MKNKEVQSTLINGAVFLPFGYLGGGPVGALGVAVLTGLIAAAKAEDARRQEEWGKKWVENRLKEDNERWENFRCDTPAVHKRLFAMIGAEANRNKIGKYCRMELGLIGKTWSEVYKQFRPDSIWATNAPVFVQFDKKPSMMLDKNKPYVQGWLYRADIFEKKLLEVLDDPNLMVFNFGYGGNYQDGILPLFGFTIDNGRSFIIEGHFYSG